MEELNDELREEELATEVGTSAFGDVDTAREEVNGAIGVTRVVGNARLTVAPFREVIGTGEGIEGAVEVFIAESSQVLIQP